MEIKVNALTLRVIDYNENDKILTLLSAEKGKITAGIKGVKKAGAKLKFAAQPFCFAEYILAMRGERYTVIGASENESFYDLRTDINKFYAASSVCEVASALTYESNEHKEMFYLSVNALTEMCTGDESIALIRFLINALRVSGYGIILDNCAECGSQHLTQQKMRFDFNSGSFTCWDCGGGKGTSLTTYHTLRAASGKMFNPECLTADGNKRALRLLKEYLVFKTEGKFLGLSEYIRLL